MLGVPVRKYSTFSGTLDGIDGLERFQCLGIGVYGYHHSECSEGTDSSGYFFTRLLQTYPPRMCEKLARMIVDTAQRMLRTGERPTGHLLPAGVQAISTAWWFPAVRDYEMGV